MQGRLTSPAAVAVAATGAKVGVLCGQRGRLDSEDGVGVGILGGDGSAALAVADKRPLGRSAACTHHDGRATHGRLGLELARQLLQMGHFVVRGHVGGVGHGKGRAAVLVVVASVLVVKAGGRVDRGAHG